ILSHMLAPFKDDHINVIVPRVKQFKAAKPLQFRSEFNNDSLRDVFWHFVDTSLRKNGFDEVGHSGPLVWGRPLFFWAVSGDLAYLRFNRCFGGGNADNIPDTKVASKLLDSVFAHFSGKRALIIDVRDNIGGNDEFAYEV